MRKKWKVSRKAKKIILVICIVAALILGIGLFLYIHMVDTQTLGRKISVCGVDVSKLTVEQAKEKIENVFCSREVVFEENEKDIYRVTLKELGYTLNSETLQRRLEKLKEERQEANVLLAVQNDYEIGYEIQRDENREKAALLSGYFGTEERSASQDAKIYYSKKKKKFVLRKEVQGNQIDEAALRVYVDVVLEKRVSSELFGDEICIELGTAVYRQPEVISSEKMENKVKKLNRRLKNYRNASITYVFGNKKVVLDSEKIESWIQIDNKSVSIDQAQASDYISKLANKYNTIYVPRTFHTSLGKDVTIKDNEYGYRIDHEAELEQLLADLKSGKEVKREPIYSNSGMQRNGKDDLAGSYIEVSLDSQHLWLYKDGALVTETDIVSGAPTKDRATYRGAWPIAYKASPFTLSSEEYGYKTTVKYWMPFVYGQGLHDASWQSSFGGDRYKTGGGSHGCINLPENQAELIFNTIDGGYPIIIY